jgi:hypothetical protein
MIYIWGVRFEPRLDTENPEVVCASLQSLQERASFHTLSVAVLVTQAEVLTESSFRLLLDDAVSIDAV